MIPKHLKVTIKNIGKEIYYIYIFQVFNGNNDRNTIVIHGLTPPIKARFIRINVKSWHGHVSMRAELYGCKAGVCKERVHGAARNIFYTFHIFCNAFSMSKNQFDFSGIS